ncbi:S49 family peptidase [Roseiconus lacunae]|uniref:S49 family peptidase n=1 Tax=Roseiconus lacunae TaxID=2605694 RepID=UPI00308DF1C2|nr:S49 family peptidase [Stieleria sp. HD01]
MRSEPYFLAPFAVEEVRSLMDAAAEFKLPQIPKRERAPDRGDVAIVEVMGPLVRRDDGFSMTLGLSSYEDIINQVNHAVEASAAIVLVIDSPGGIAVGALRCAEVIAAAAKEIPVISVVDGLCASAGYFLAAGSTSIIASPDSWIGSVGSIMELRSFAEMERNMGIETTIITTGEYKSAGNPSEPMAGHVRDYFAGLNEKTGQHFSDHVAKHRKLSKQQRQEIEAAKVYTADDAMKVGLIDGVAFADDVIKSIYTGGNPRSARGVASLMGPVQRDVSYRRSQGNATRNDTELAAATFWEAVDKAQNDRQCTRADAMRLAAAKHPGLAAIAIK